MSNMFFELPPLFVVTCTGSPFTQSWAVTEARRDPRRNLWMHEHPGASSQILPRGTVQDRRGEERRRRVGSKECCDIDTNPADLNKE